MSEPTTRVKKALAATFQGPDKKAEFWKLQYELVRWKAQELLNKIHYSNDLHAIFNIKDCEQYKELQEEINKIGDDK